MQRNSRDLEPVNKLIYIGSALVLVSSCSSDPPKRGSAPTDPAAYAADWMTFERKRKPREKNSFDFYYKHCSIEDRAPIPVGDVWTCTDP